MPEVGDQIKTQTAASTTNKKKAPGLAFRRFFTKPGVSPYSEVEWELRTAQITDSQGGMIFEQNQCRGPQRLVHDRDQHCRLEISPRTNRYR